LTLRHCCDREHPHTYARAEELLVKGAPKADGSSRLVVNVGAEPRTFAFAER
jgi:hypothetical protein